MPTKTSMKRDIRRKKEIKKNNVRKNKIKKVIPHKIPFEVKQKLKEMQENKSIDKYSAILPHTDQNKGGK